MHEVKINCPSCGNSNQILLKQTDSKYVCYECRSELFEDKIIFGFIYLLSNEFMPDLLKIGYCTRTVEERVKELNSQTGVPNPFTVEAYFGSNKPEEDEKNIHKELENYRIQKKEFFKISSTEAIENIARMLDSKPIYVLSLIEHTAKEPIKNSEPEIKTSEICPQCGNVAIPDAFKIWIKCHSCGWTKRNLSDPDAISDLELYLKGKYRRQRSHESKSLRDILKGTAKQHYEEGLKENNPEIAIQKMEKAASLGHQKAEFWLKKQKSVND
jgi:ribosomal protein S27AE